MARWMLCSLRRATVCALSAAALLSLPVRHDTGLANPPVADQERATRRAEMLDTLFADLGKASDQAAADAIVARIWDRWMLSGRDDVDVLMSRVVANMAARHFGLALLLVEEVIELEPKFAEGWNKRATLHYQMGRYDESLADIEKTLQLEPRHFGALAGRAAIYADTKKWKDALEAYRAALAVNPFLQRRATVLQMLEKQAGERAL
jgi:tetratricopeptide (TPR) repeat protein